MRKNYKQPRDTTRVNPIRLTDNARGIRVTVNTLVYHRGYCPGANLNNPHDRGADPKNCDHCFAIVG